MSHAHVQAWLIKYAPPLVLMLYARQPKYLPPFCGNISSDKNSFHAAAARYSMKIVSKFQPREPTTTLSPS